MSRWACMVVALGCWDTSESMPKRRLRVKAALYPLSRRVLVLRFTRCTFRDVQPLPGRRPYTVYHKVCAVHVDTCSRISYDLP